MYATSRTHRDQLFAIATRWLNGHSRALAMRIVVGMLVCVVVGAVPLIRAGETSSTAPSPRPALNQDRGTWRFEFDNDVFLRSDNQFTAGWSLHKYGPLASHWAEVGGTWAFGRRLAAWFLPEHRADLVFREGWILGQNIQTPDDLERPDLIVDDVPYCATLAIQNSWIAWNDKQFYGFGWLYGVAGPAAMGDEVQRAVHELIGATEPRGWDHQLRNEPLMNFSWHQKRRFWSGKYADIAFDVGAEFGNAITAAGLSLEIRFGARLPRGFAYRPDPTGTTLSYDAHLPYRDTEHAKLYGSLITRGSVVARYLLLDGNTFRNSHSVRREPAIGELIVGLHYERRRWAIHLHVWLTTNTVDPAVVTAEPDATSDFGSLTIEFRI